MNFLEEALETNEEKVYEITKKNNELIKILQEQQNDLTEQQSQLETSLQQN